MEETILKCSLTNLDKVSLLKQRSITSYGRNHDPLYNAL